MGGIALTASVALAGVATARPQADADAPLADRAVVELATPTVPTGDGRAAARERRRLRTRSADLIARVIERNALDPVGAIPETGQVAVALGGESVAELRRRLAGDPRVQEVSPDRRVIWRFLPNDPAFTSGDPNAPGGDYMQWYLRHLGGPGAWDLSRGAGARVAVIDTGIYTAHPDLSARIVDRLNCVGGCGGTSITDNSGHGTHVAGLACGDSNNGFGVASLGFDCSLVGIKIGSSCADAAAAVVAAANRGSDAISMSFGGCDSSMNNELSYALGRGSVLVAAGDNEPSPDPTLNFPAQWIQPRGTGPNASFNRGLVVGAARYGGTRAAFSQLDTGISVLSFGAASEAASTQARRGLVSTFPPPTFPPLGQDFGGARTTVAGDNRFAYLYGTSMATPQVSGLVALIRASQPALAASEVGSLIKRTAGDCATYGAGVGWGLINPVRALVVAQNLDIDPPRSEVRRARRSKLRLTSGDDGTGSACESPAAGIKTVELYVARKRKYRLIGTTSRDVWKFKRSRRNKDFRFVPKRGKRYRFYSVAVDNAGNREAAPERADAKLKPKRKKRKRR